MRFFKRLSYLFCGFMLMASAGAEAQSGLQNPELLEKSGLTHSIDAIPVAMIAGIEEARRASPSIDAKFVQAWRATIPIAYQPEKILRRIDQGLEKALTAEDKRQLLAYYNSPLGKRTTELENAAINATTEITEYAKNPAVYADRVALYKELDKETGASTIGATIAENMGVAIQIGVFSAANMSFDINALKLQAANERPNIVKQAETEILQTFAYTYRDLRKDELEAYVTFMKTPVAKTFNKALGKLLTDALSGQANELGQLLIKNLQSGAPT